MNYHNFRYVLSLSVLFFLLFSLSPKNDLTIKRNVIVGSVGTNPNSRQEERLNDLINHFNSIQQEIRFTIESTRNYKYAIEKICSGQWSILFAFSPGVVVGSDECDAIIGFPTLVDVNSLSNQYYSAFFVSYESSIDSLDDLTNVSVALNQVGSASGFSIPLYELRSYSDIVYSSLGSYQNIASSVIQGTHDVGVAPFRNHETFLQNYPPNLFKIIHLSQPIPGGSIVFSRHENQLDIDLFSSLFIDFFEIFEENFLNQSSYLFYPYLEVNNYDYIRRVQYYIDSLDECLYNNELLVSECIE